MDGPSPPSLLPKMTTRNNCVSCIRQIVIEYAEHLETQNRKIVHSYFLPTRNNDSSNEEEVFPLAFTCCNNDVVLTNDILHLEQTGDIEEYGRRVCTPNLALATLRLLHASTKRSLYNCASNKLPCLEGQCKVARDLPSWSST